MSLLTVAVSLAMLGGVPKGSEETGPVRFEIRLLQMKGVDWRASVHGRLNPGESPGSYSVWTAPRSVVDDLQKACEATVCAPAVSAEPGSNVTIADVKVRNMVADVRRVANGPEGKNTCVAMVPVIGAIRDGFDANISGRPKKEGILTHAELTDTRFVAFHSVTIPETFVDPKTRETSTTTALIQVPEVVRGTAKGEWLIPTDGILVISMGAYSTTDKNGKLSMHERLAIIEPSCVRSDASVAQVALKGPGEKDEPCVEEACCLEMPITSRAMVIPSTPATSSIVMALASPTVAPQPAWKASLSMTASASLKSGQARGKFTLFGVPLPISTPPFVSVDVKVAPKEEIAAKPMPALPSRDLPTAIAADGTVVPLPPLPDPDLVATADDSDTETRPAPQALPRGKRSVTPSAPVAEGVSSLARITRFEARGNTLIVRDPADGTCRLVCDDLLVFPTAAPAVAAGECCAHGTSENVLADRTAGALVPARGSSVRMDTATLPVEFRQEEAEAIVEDDLITLGFELNSSLRGCEYDSTVSVKNLQREPITLKIPMADGSVVEVTARLVKKSTK